MKRIRVLLLADVAGSGHRDHAGDEAMTEVALERLKSIAGRDRLVLACPHPWTAGRVYGVKAISLPMHSMRTWLARIVLLPLYTWYQICCILWYVWRAEVVFKAGGGNIRGRYSKFPILSLARLMRKKVILVSQTIGPLQEAHRSVLRRQLREAAWIGVRDRGFSGRQLGLPVHFAADDAVFLTPRHSASTSHLAKAYPRMVGISYLDFHKMGRESWRPLSEATEEAVMTLKATPVFIPHFAPHGRGDLEAARLMAREWRRVEPVLLNEVPPAPAIMALTGALQLVLASRYHAVVFGLAMGVPTVAVYADAHTEARMRGAFEQFDLEPAVLPLEDVRQQLCRAVANALHRREEFVAAAARVRQDGLAANMAPYELLGSMGRKT